MCTDCDGLQAKIAAKNKSANNFVMHGNGSASLYISKRDCYKLPVDIGIELYDMIKMEMPIKIDIVYIMRPGRAHHHQRYIRAIGLLWAFLPYFYPSVHCKLLDSLFDVIGIFVSMAIYCCMLCRLCAILFAMLLYAAAVFISGYMISMLCTTLRRALNINCDNYICV